MERIRLFQTGTFSQRAVLLDIFDLEGPDFLTGEKETLRDGLVERYSGEKLYVKYGSIIINLTNNHTKNELKELLDRTGRVLESIYRKQSDGLDLFIQLIVSRPVNEKGTNCWKQEVAFHLLQVPPLTKLY